jgi:hypothetical protein
MSYMNIDNLYKAKDILLFRECWALEKIDGTSAHVAWKYGAVRFFSGGTKHETFITLFDAAALTAKFTELGHPEVVVFGEAYGGKTQGKSDTYGKAPRFVAFEVKIGESWLCVTDAEKVVLSLGLDFVPYERCKTDLEAIDAMRDKPSVQAVKCGITEPRKREGIVLRPFIELRKNNGARIIAKHKAEDERETKTPRSVNPDKLKVLAEAQAIADEWVTEMRLSHVLQAFPDYGMEQAGAIISAMIADVEREGAGEIVPSPEAKREIGRRTALMLKARLRNALAANAAAEGAKQ